MTRETGLMRGKRGIIFGVANARSIAWGIAKALHAQGAEIALTWQGDALKKRVEPLIASIGMYEMVECDVSSEESMDALFARLKEKWGTIDFLVHAIGFSDKNELRGRYVDTSLAFFACLYLAALNASIGLLEVVVSNWVDVQKKMERGRATGYSGVVALILSALPALSSSVFKNIRVGGKSLIESLDSLLINWLLPVVALFVSMAFNLGTTLQEKESSFVDRERFISFSMYPHWVFMLKWGAPFVIVLGVLTSSCWFIFLKYLLIQRTIYSRIDCRSVNNPKLYKDFL